MKTTKKSNRLDKFADKNQKHEVDRNNNELLTKQHRGKQTLILATKDISKEKLIAAKLPSNKG